MLGRQRLQFRLQPVLPWERRRPAGETPVFGVPRLRGLDDLRQADRLKAELQTAPDLRSGVGHGKLEV